LFIAAQLHERETVHVRAEETLGLFAEALEIHSHDRAGQCDFGPIADFIPEVRVNDLFTGLFDQVDERPEPATDCFDHACLDALRVLWPRAKAQISKRASIIRVGVTLLNITPSEHRQLDLMMDDDKDCQRWEAITDTIDGLNAKFGKRVVTMGPWSAPPGGFTGGKIAFTRIPSAEDFW
jgi:hypothetical protein